MILAGQDDARIGAEAKEVVQKHTERIMAEYVLPKLNDCLKDIDNTDWENNSMNPFPLGSDKSECEHIVNSITEKVQSENLEILDLKEAYTLTQVLNLLSFRFLEYKDRPGDKAAKAFADGWKINDRREREYLKERLISGANWNTATAKRIEEHDGLQNFLTKKKWEPILYMYETPFAFNRMLITEKQAEMIENRMSAAAGKAERI